MYELAENFDQAASCYIRLKNWTKVGTLLAKVTSSKIHSQFAKVWIMKVESLLELSLRIFIVLGYGGDGQP